MLNSYKDLTFAQQQRRGFLKTLTQAGLSLPLVQASGLGAGMLLGRQAYGAVGAKRVIFVYAPDGTPGGGVQFVYAGCQYGIKSMHCAV